MVKVVIGDMFQSGAQTLVNTVNCIGIMGKGIALEFKKRFPVMYDDYVRRCGAGQVKLGEPYVFRRLVPPWILNFPTKDHWRSISRLEDIVRGLQYLERHYREWGVTSLAVPPLGCGQGQLEWRVVGPTLYRHLQSLTIPVGLYAPYGTPHEELQPVFLEQAPAAEGTAAPAGVPSHLPASWVALVEILAQIQREPHHWPVGRTTFQKIAYFATESGIPTGLHYQRGSYGPFAPELKNLMTRLVNHALIREDRLGRMFTVTPGPTFADARQAFATDLDQWRQVIEKLADLFMRTRTQEAEVAATVHFATRQLAIQRRSRPSEVDVLAEVLSWKAKRRPPLEEAEVAIAIRNLSMLGWLDVQASPELPVAEEVLLDA